MKTIIALILFAVIFGQASSQTVPLAIRMDLVTRITLEEKGYLKNGVGTLNIEVFPYTIYKVETSGQYYINVTNSRLTKSRKYLGWAWGVHEYEDNTVFFNKDTTKCWIWTVDRYGQIFKMDMPNLFSDWARTAKDSIP